MVEQNIGSKRVFGIFQRNGQVYLEPIPEAKAKILSPIIKKKVKVGADVFFDTGTWYAGLVGLGHVHRTVDHGKQEYVDGEVHINGPEGFWGLSKTNIHTYKGIKKKNWLLYLKEMEFRYNNRLFPHHIILNVVSGSVGYVSCIVNNMDSSNPTFLKKLLFLSFILIVISTGSFLLINQKTSTSTIKQHSTWLKYDGRVDFVSGDGKLITLEEEQGGGIILLPENYQEQKEDVNITVRDLKANTEKKLTILKEISEFASVKFLPNRVDGSKIWVVTYNAYNCEDSLKAENSVKEESRDSCDFKLYEFNLESGNLTFKKDGSYFVGRQILGIYPLTHDPTSNTMWLAVDYIDKNYNYWDSKTQKNKQIEASFTGFINYDANTNEMGFPISINRRKGNSRWSPYIKGVAGKAKIADIDRNGDLYVVTKCGLDRNFENLELCYNDPVQKDISVYRIPLKPTAGEWQFGQIPIFTYTWPPSEYGLPEIAIDSTSQTLYMATKTWSADKESVFFSYDIERKRTTVLGGQPTQYEDDVLGISTVKGKLLSGHFHGLGVYDHDTDKWKVLTTENGLQDNHAETIYSLNNGGVCVLHESKGASCLYNPL